MRQLTMEHELRSSHWRWRGLTMILCRVIVFGWIMITCCTIVEYRRWWFSTILFEHVFVINNLHARTVCSHVKLYLSTNLKLTRVCLHITSTNIWYKTDNGCRNLDTHTHTHRYTDRIRPIAFRYLRWTVVGFYSRIASYYIKTDRERCVEMVEGSFDPTTGVVMDVYKFLVALFVTVKF